MRTLLDLWIGLAAGAVAVRARWPFAPDLIEASGRAPWRNTLAGAVGLAVALLFIALRPRPSLAQPGLVVLVGVFVGAASALLDPSTGGAPWAWVALGALGIACGRWVERRSGATRAEGGDAGAVSPTWPSCASLVLLAAGVTTACVSLARLTARTMPDATPDHTARAITFAALLVVGAFAFGRPFTAPSEGDARAREGGSRSPLEGRDGDAVVSALIVAAFAAFAGLVVVGGVTSPQGLRSLTRRFDVDVAASGTLAFDVLVSLAAFVLPAFALGAALHLVRARRAWVALALGAALGVVAAARLEPLALVSAPSLGANLETGLGASPGTSLEAGLPAPPEVALRVAGGSSARVLDGLVLAGLGAVLAAVFRVRGRRRVALGVVGVAAITIALQLDLAPIRVLRAYERFQPIPVALVEGASGQFIVDPARMGIERVTLDQRALAPSSERAQGDRDQLTAALALLPEGTLARGARVLLVGPLTPGRALTLRALGVARVDRSAGYWADLAALEAFLARRLTGPNTALIELAGEVLAPRAARRRAAAGEYDLVVAPAVEGQCAEARFLDAPDGVVQVLWFEGEDDAAAALADARVLLAADGPEHLSVGRVRGGGAALEAARAPTAGAPAYVPLAPTHAGRARLARRQYERLALTEEVRRAANERALVARFVEGARGTPWLDLARGYSLHLAAQLPSSPFETPSQRVELDREALDLFFAHGTLGPPERLTRGLWNALAEVLQAKRDVETTYALIEPLAELWAPWPEGALALAWADGEELDHVGAVERLAPLARDAPGDRPLVTGYATALLAAGRPAEAAAALEVLVALAPRERALAKALARARIAAKDPAGRELALELLREDPSDRELWGLLGPAGALAPSWQAPARSEAPVEDVSPIK